MAVFIVLWPYLLTSKLRSVIRHNLGHSKVDFSCANSTSSANFRIFFVHGISYRPTDLFLLKEFSKKSVLKIFIILFEQDCPGAVVHGLLHWIGLSPLDLKIFRLASLQSLRNGGRT